MALNVDILSVNSLFINGVDILSNKIDYVELVGDEKIVIDVPSATYTKAIPQIGVNLGDVELKTTPLDGKTFDSINNAGGVSVDGVSHIVDVNGCYVSNINIDSFVINKTSVIKSLDYTTYKWHDVDYGRYDLALSCDSLSEIGSNGLSLYGTGKTILNTNVYIDTNIYKFGKSSMKFNGGSSKIAVNSGLTDFGFGTGDFTIEGWVNPTTYSYGTASVIWFSNNICLSIYKGKFNCYNYGSGYIFSNPTKGVTYDWTHLALVRSAGILTLYVNGVVSDSVTYNNNITSPQLINMGSYDTNAESYYGYIDEFRVSKVARYLEPFTPPTHLVGTDPNTVFYLDGEEIVDKTNAIIVPSTDFQTGTASYEFNGTNYITAPSNPKYALGTDDFTIELYAKVTYLDATYGAFIIENRFDGNDVGNYGHYTLRMLPNGILKFTISSYDTLINGTALYGTTNQFNKWCHIALVRSSGVIKLYVNGIEESSYDTPLNFTRDTFNIGRGAYGSGFLIGLIDDLRITKGLARYTENFTPSTTLDTGTRPVKVAQHQGTVIQSELSYSDYLVSYGTAIDPWVAVQPSITVSGEPFTLIDSVITSSNTFTSTETFNVGDIVSSDKETFGTIIFEENGEFMVDDDIFFDGVTDKPFTPSDANIVNFVKDKRSNLYTNGLRDALLSAVSSTIYGHINDEIIVDAGEGGSFILGTMYTSGGYQYTDTTSQFNISVSDDGITYTVIYENLENLMTNHAHIMTGTGRFIKITFLNEITGWGRIITNFVDGKWWDLHIVHPMSKVYNYAARLEVNGKSIVPNYIQWFDNMTINKIVCDKVFINPTTVLNINTENISKVELDLWQEVKGVI